MTRARLLVLLGTTFGAPAGAPAACAPGRPHAPAEAPDAAAARGLALRRLFFERERAARLVLWDDPAPGPAFEALGRRPAPLGAGGARRVAAVVGAPVVTVTADTLARLFRAHADGWAAFYRRYAGAPGLVEVGPAERAGAGAAVVVGRACGEHCLNAWRVTLGTGAAGGWRVTGVAPLRVPGA